MQFKKPILSPVARIALGLVSQAVFIVLALGLLFNILPEQIEAKQKIRDILNENVAQQALHSFQVGKLSELDSILEQTAARENGLRSIGIRRINGELLAATGPHELLWKKPDNANQSLDFAVIPITANQAHLADVELTYTPLRPSSIWAWLKYPPIAIVSLISILAFVAFYLYLRRVLEYLNPLSVIPERVRQAYDTFRDALLVLDTRGRIILANEAFRKLHPAAGENISGKAIAGQNWLVEKFELIENRYPWIYAMESRKHVSCEPVEIAQIDDTPPLKIVLNCSAIEDGYGNIRGCMLIFSDVTDLHRLNQQLREALENLEASKLEVEEKNVELAKLATRDPLTGCLNRRAMFERIGPMLSNAIENNEDICFVMADIDHFKRFNDMYGHSVGDQVLKLVVRLMGSGLRETDLLCRYGGEEFCIILPGTSLEQAWSITDRLRQQIDAEAGNSLRDHQHEHITCSFGIASIRHPARTADAIIDLADQALYHAKKTGRNRVMIWDETMPVKE